MHNFKIIKTFSLIFVLLIMLFISSCSSKDSNTPNNPIEIKDIPIVNLEGANVKTFETEEDLQEFIQMAKTTSSFYRNYNGDDVIAIEDEPIPTAPQEGNVDGNNTNSNEYQTNTAVASVDEADIVKVSGDYIFYLTNKVTRILKKNKDTLDEVKTIYAEESDELVQVYGEVEVRHFSSNTMLDLYITDRYLIIRSSIHEYDYTRYNNHTENQNWMSSTNFDIYDLKDFSIVKSLKIFGSIVSTRLFKNCLYIANSVSFSSFNRPIIAIDNVYLEAPLDHIFYYSADYQINGFVSIYKLELTEEFPLMHTHLLTGYAEEFYMSEEHMYLLRPYNYVREEYDTYDNYFYQTFISVIDNESLGVVSTIGVFGTILDKYSLNEKDNYLRIVTTGEVNQKQKVGKYYYHQSSNIVNALTIFEFKETGLEKISYLDKGLGKPGERVKSARFNGDMVTIVTFRQIDPLYYVDLTDPYNPIITSELEITGYSVYQHPFKDDYVIGFGYEVVDNRNVGYKITLFDVSDKNNIQAVGESFIIKADVDSGYVYTPSFFYNPKELMVDVKHGFFGFAYQAYYYNYNNYNYNYRYVSNYVVIKVDPTCKTPIRLELELTADANTSMFDRMVYLEDYYYALSNSEVVIYRLVDGSLNLQSKMKFR